MAVFMGIKVPVVIEIVPLFLIFLKPSFFGGLRYTDFLFFILLANSIVFFILNLDDLSWIGNIEARAFFLLAINYFIFRILIRREWSENIAELVLKLIELSMYLMLIEFILINISDIANSIESTYLSVYPDRQRLYENLMNFTKPIGLYPGTHNAGLAATISLLYLKATKTISSNKGFFIASVLVFLICFSLTAFLVLIIVYLMFFLSGKTSVLMFVKTMPFGIFMVMMLYFSILNYEAITTFRSSGVGGITSNVAFKDAQYIYSLVAGFEALKNSPFGTPINKADFFHNEVYFSRAVMYYGIPIVVFFLLTFSLVASSLKHQNRSGLFYSISFLVIFISSFHYPAIISYPLNILIPLTFVFLGASQDKLLLRKNVSSGIKIIEKSSSS